MAGLYIHIPFCRRKCLYCDFFSGSPSIADWQSYAAAVEGELRQRIAELHHIDTIYIGGGTPSLIPSDIFTDLIRSIRNIIAGENVGLTPNAEFTIEVNPDDICRPDSDTPDHSESDVAEKDGIEKIEAWLTSGVNRISMGVQSFDDTELKTIGRRHTSRQAIKAYHRLSEYFDNISIDLMYGLPGQTLECWRHTITQAIALKPAHISAYSLMYEEGTALTILRQQGRLTELPEEITLRMFGELRQSLANAGYQQYEISNFSLPGLHSRHNSSYWHRQPYLGLGPSAHSYDGDRLRRANPPRIKEYIDRFCIPEINPPTPFYKEEHLTDAELMEEAIMLGLRTAEGINLTEYSHSFGDAAASRLLTKAGKSLHEGTLTLSDNHLRLTPESIMTSDAVILSLFDAVPL